MTNVFVDNDEGPRHNGGMKTLAVALVAMTAAGVVSGQSSAAPVFDVSDIRPYKPEAGETGIHGIIVANGVPGNFSQLAGQRMQLGVPVYQANGTVIMRSATVRELITQAYKEILRPEYLGGGPNWVDTDHFELIAKAPPGTPLDTERLMLQAVLAGKKELKLQAVDAAGAADCKQAFAQADGHTHVTCVNMTMAGLAARLSRLEPFDVNQPAVDLTGIAGSYNFQLEWTPRGPSQDPVGLTVFDPLEKLGLKLEARKEPVTVIAIDRVDRLPDEN
jgi:Protein of unknown function (DUF3738)